MKKIILAACCLSVFTSLSAQSNQPALVLWHTDGSKTRIELNDKPNVTFLKDSMNVVATSVSFSYAVKDVPRFSYENVASGFTNNLSDASFRIIGENVYFYGVTDKKNIALYSIDGKLQNIQLDGVSFGFVLHISQLPTGVYLLKVNNRITKIIKR